MAITGMQIYKSLPKTNCKDCGFPTCMAFAMQVAAKKKALADCPHVSDEAKDELSSASAPPMVSVKIGVSEAEVEIGKEISLFRHEGKFQNQPVLTVKIGATLSDQEAADKLDIINNARFTRVGQQLAVRGVAVDLSEMTPDSAAARATLIMDKSKVAIVLTGGNEEAMKAAVEAISACKPLICCPAENISAYAAVAAANNCPLAASANSLELIADATEAAKAAGVKDIVMCLDGLSIGDTVRELTRARRAAIKKKFRAVGYPAMIDVSNQDPLVETAQATTCVAKYASLIIIDHTSNGELLSILTASQDIYTDPQVPNTVESKLYEIGAVNENSPVLVTTNFSLSYFCVENEVERSRIPSYILAVDTEGLGVLNAFAGDKLSPEKVISSLEACEVKEKVNHCRLIIPGLLPSFKAEIEENSPWKEVLIGPESASGIPAFLTGCP